MHVERNMLALLSDLDKRFPKCVADRKLIEHVWVVSRQICYHQIGICNMLYYLASDVTRPLNVIGTYGFLIPTALDCRPNHVVEELIGASSDFGILCADGCDHEAYSLFRVRHLIAPLLSCWSEEKLRAHEERVKVLCS